MDGDRTALYAAELAAFDGTDLEQLQPFEGVVALGEALMAGEWWPGPAVQVRRSRSDSLSSSTRCATGTAGEIVSIRLAPGQTTVATLAHELAHALAGAERGHDETFRAAYVDVIAAVTNVHSTDRRRDLHVEQLLAAFGAAGLPIGQRRWPPPPPSTSGAIAL